jgi:hypothetical protein
MRALRSSLIVLSVVLLCGRALAENNPAVLFVGVTPHAAYVARPLHEMGFELDVCEPAELAERLESQRFNVVVLGPTYDVDLEPVIAAFLEGGGGVFTPAPFGHMGRAAHWFPTPEWAAAQGATMRWHELEDDTTNLLVDDMGVSHSFSDRVRPPAAAGVGGLLTTVGRSGGWPPLAFDYDDRWTVAVQWAASVRPKSAEHKIGRFESFWWHRQPLTDRSGLLGVREVGQGRLAICGIPSQWLLSPPRNCPTVEATLSGGVGDRSSDWLLVLANTFRWLAEPSLKAGTGGAATPENLLLDSEFIPDPAEIDWSGPRPIVRDAKHPLVLPAAEDLPQLRGLVGARTVLSGSRGTVAEYAAEARKAGLDYLVFLEDALQMDEAAFAELKRQCAAVSDGLFAAIPGLTIEDAQGNHFFYIGDNLKFPTPDMTLPDGRLDTTAVSRTEAIFKYGWQYMNYRVLIGWWKHAGNHTPIADYKLYNSFPIRSFEDGKPIDDAFADYLKLTGWGCCPMVFALELMSGPEQVAKRAAAGWQTIATLGGEYGDGTYVKQEPYGVAGLRERWKGAPAWFPPYLYISNGPQILCWTPQNNCVVAKGDWWRPDLWQYRARLHVNSDVGLRKVTIYDGDRGVFRRWLPEGSRSFEHTLVLAHDRQRDLVLVVEDVEGRRAISMELWNRNTTFDQVICGDRCNFLGTAFLRRKDGTAIWHRPGFRENLGLSPSKGSMKEGTWFQPATGLSVFPTLPIDGQPQSLPTPSVETLLTLPGEHRELHSNPSTYLFSPEYAVGQGNFGWAYDPQEYGVEQTPLGHPYREPAKQAQIGKNAWTSWYRLVPTRLMDGWVRLHATQATLGDVRLGKFQLHVVPKDDVAVDSDHGWDILRVAIPSQVFAGGTATSSDQGDFGPGTVAVFSTPGGTAALCGGKDRLEYRIEKGTFVVSYRPDKGVVAKGTAVNVDIPFFGMSNRLEQADVLQTLADFGVLEPGRVGYAPTITRGHTIDAFGCWQTKAEDGGFECMIPQTPLRAMIPLQVTGLNDGWSAFVVDRQRPGINFRPIPVRDGCGYALLDPTAADTDFFVGHPLQCDEPAVRLQVAWMAPGRWFVEAHNDSSNSVTTTIATDRSWPCFSFHEEITLARGSSRVWEVEER